MTKEETYAYEINLDDSGLVPVKLVRLVGENRRVLELGSASGHMSRVLKEKFGCTVVGVEIDPEWAEKARPYCERMIIGDLEQLDFAKELGDDRFDVILCADVLEHLRDPWRILGELRGYLKPEGRVIISVPNGAFHGILAEMCDGKFGYRKIGLLDQSHLRFFTRRELELLVLTAGLVPLEWDHVLKGAEHSEFAESWEKLPGQFQGLLRSIKDGEVYQLIVCAHQPSKAEWDAYLRNWEKRIDEGETSVARVNATLNASLVEKNGQLAEKDHRLAVMAEQLADYEQRVVQREQAFRELQEREEQRRNQLENRLFDMEGHMRRQWINIGARLAREVELNRDLNLARGEVVTLTSGLAARAEEASVLRTRIADLEREIHGFVTSRSWRLTAPLRGMTQFLRGVDVQPAVAPLPIVVETLPQPAPAPAFQLDNVIRTNEYREYLGCFRPCPELTDEIRWAMRAQIDAMEYKPVIIVRFSVLGLDDASFQQAFDAVRYQLYPRWELWVLDSEWATPAQKEQIRKGREADPRIHADLVRLGQSAAQITADTHLGGDYIYLLNVATIPPELAFYRLAFYINRTNPEIAVRNTVMPEEGSYDLWLAQFEPARQRQVKALVAASADFAFKPLISVVMPVYNVPEKWLRRAIQSVIAQHYSNWELCIADDCSTEPHVRELLEEYSALDARIKVVFRDKNGHISACSNSALEIAKGEYTAFLDHDDELTQDALLWVVERINRNPEATLIYSDEDKIGVKNERRDPYFKPDWNYDLLLSQNYVCHLGVYRTDLLREIGGFREGFEGAQDYDLVLRFSERIVPAQICHIPRVLYHWRAIPGSTANLKQEIAAKPYALDAAIRALQEHLERRGIPAEVIEDAVLRGSYRVSYALPAEHPLVSLIILTRNGLKLLRQCVESVVAKTTYKPYEILIVDNGSDDPETLAYMAELQERKVARILRDDSPFNFSALNNRAVREAKGSVLALLNNDIEVISPDWLGEMVSHALRPDVGAVGARLWYPDDTLQHGGVILVGGVAGHAHKHLALGRVGYCRRAALIQNFSAVTAACLVLRKDVYEEVHGLDESLQVAFNDVDFCLRIRAAGYRNLWTPYAELYHHESATRGYEDTPEKKARFEGEIRTMRARWAELLDNDPAYNPNLAFYREDFTLSFPPRPLP